MAATFSKTVTDEQFAARELVRDWAAASGATAAVRATEQGEPDAWRPVFGGLNDLGLFGVAVPEDCGGAGGSIEDLCAMVEEAAKALVPGPVATTALATLVVADPQLRAALASGERTAGVALDGDVEFDLGRHLAGLGHGALGAGCGRRRPAVGAGRRKMAARRAMALLTVWRSSRCLPPTSPGRWRGWC